MRTEKRFQEGVTRKLRVEALRNPPFNELKSKRQRTAALQDLAEGIVRNPPRQRLGVRLSSAAFVAPFLCFMPLSFGDAIPQVGGYEIKYQDLKACS